MNNWNCNKCGNCCSNILPLLKEEIEILRKLAKKENKKVFMKDWYDICPFLNSKNECDIYENRPLICKDFTCYKFKNNIYESKLFENRKENEFKITDIRKDIFNV